MIKIEIDVLPPKYPNFVQVDGSVAHKELLGSIFAGTGRCSVDIGKIPDEKLLEYAELWKAGLITHARERRERIDTSEGE